MTTALWLIVPVIVILPLVSLWQVKRSTSIVRNWAQANGLALNSREFRWVRRGPFSGMATGSWQAVHRVTVTTSEGERMCGWVHCKNLYSTGHKIEVKWDEPPITEPNATPR